MEPPLPEDSPAITVRANVQPDEMALTGLIEQMRSDQQQMQARQTRADAHLGLGFHPVHFPAFDGQFRAALSPALHENLAIIRNYLLCHLPEERAASTLKQIARRLDASLSGRNRWPHAPKLTRRAASQPDKGAQALYQHLLAWQSAPRWLHPPLWFTPDQPAHWGLPPLESSPFSDRALAMSAPPEDAPASQDAMPVDFGEMADRNHIATGAKQAVGQPPEAEQSTAEQLNDIANDIASAGALTMSVEELHEPTRRESIEIAKEILDKLRVRLGEAFVSHGLGPFGAENLSILNSLKEVVKTFEFHLHKLAGLDPNIYENPAVKRANEAVGKLSHLAKSETLGAAQLHGDAQMIALIEAEMMQLPASWIPGEHDTFGGLFDDLYSGLEAVIDRINHIGDHDAGASYWLGFSSEKSLGNSDPGKGNTGRQEKAMADDQYFRQVNAQRALRARQAAIRYTQSMQRKRMHDAHDDTPHHHPPQQQQQQASKSAAAGLGNLLNADALATMRDAMKTTKGAGQVEAGGKSNIQNVLKQKEQATRSQRQRVTLEQITRANKRSQELADERMEPPPPPAGKKKDHGKGV